MTRRISAYRPEIDGLRAVAVGSVILFHAGFGSFSGGFVGVDVFFVISGFLITGILIDEHDRGTFSFASFYARRARRILPALAFVLLACIPPTLLLMIPSQSLDFFRALIAAALFGSNVLHAQTTGYFDAPAEERPILHTWSLSVEEQYYFLLPLLLSLCWRWSRRHVGPVLGLLALASLAASEYGWRYHPGPNFFSSPSRVWELLMGSLAAVFCQTRPALTRNAPVHSWLAAAGLGCIVGSVLFFDRQTPTPSVWILIPTAGTALVLLYGNGSTWIGQLLAQRWLVFVGLISYSAYLWHQPILVFARLYSLQPLSEQSRAVLVLLTLGLAYLTWKFIEQPFRAMNKLSNQRTLCAALACSLGLTLVGIAGSAYSSSVGARVPASVQRAFLVPARTGECLDVPFAHNKKTGWYCNINPAGAQKPSFFVFGDSHGLQLVSAFDAAAAAAGRTGQFAGFSGCIPFLGVYPLTRQDQATNDCHALNLRVLAHVKAQGFKEVILVAKWSYYTDLWNGTTYLNALGLEKSDQVSIEQSRKAFEKGLRTTTEAYRRLGVTLNVIEQVPQQLHSPAAVFALVWADPMRAGQRLKELSVPIAKHQSLQAFSRAMFKNYSQVPGVRILRLDPLFCDQRVCAIGTPDTSYYQDPSHLSQDGAARAIPILTKLLTTRS